VTLISHPLTEHEGQTVRTVHCMHSQGNQVDRSHGWPAWECRRSERMHLSTSCVHTDGGWRSIHPVTGL